MDEEACNNFAVLIKKRSATVKEWRLNLQASVCLSCAVLMKTVLRCAVVPEEIVWENMCVSVCVTERTRIGTHLMPHFLVACPVSSCRNTTWLVVMMMMMVVSSFLFLSCCFVQYCTAPSSKLLLVFHCVGIPTGSLQIPGTCRWNGWAHAYVGACLHRISARRRLRSGCGSSCRGTNAVEKIDECLSILCAAQSTCPFVTGR